MIVTFMVVMALLFLAAGTGHAADTKGGQHSLKP